MRPSSRRVLSVNPTVKPKKPPERASSSTVKPKKPPERASSSRDSRVRLLGFQGVVPHNPVLNARDQLRSAVLQIYSQLTSRSFSSRAGALAEPRIELTLFIYERIVKRMIRLTDEQEVFSLIISTIESRLHDFSAAVATAVVNNNLKGLLFVETINNAWDTFSSTMHVIVQPLMHLEARSPAFATLPGKVLSLWAKTIMRGQMKINFKDSFVNILGHFFDVSYGDILVPGTINALRWNLEMLIFLGVDLYEQLFEIVFLEQARRFSAEYSKRFLDVLNKVLTRIQKESTTEARLSLSDEISLYLENVETRLQKDTARFAQFLPLGTRSRLLSILQTNMIQKHLDTFLDVLPTMLLCDKFEDLKRMSNLLAGLPPDCLQLMCMIVSAHMLEEGGDILDQVLDPLDYVQRLLQFTFKYEKISAESFQDEVTLREAVASALVSVISCNTLALEFIAVFLDDHLRTNLEFLTDEVLDSMVGLLGYLDRKDLFLRLYADHRQIRFLSGNTWSEEAERKVVTTLAKHGFEYFGCEFPDIQTSTGLTRNCGFVPDINHAIPSVQEDLQERFLSGVEGENSVTTEMYILAGLENPNIVNPDLGQKSQKTLESDMPYHFDASNEYLENVIMGFIGQSSTGPDNPGS